MYLTNEKTKFSSKFNESCKADLVERSKGNLSRGKIKEIPGGLSPEKKRDVCERKKKEMCARCILASVSGAPERIRAHHGRSRDALAPVPE